MILLSPARYPILHFILLLLLILMSLISSITILITSKRFLKGPIKSYLILNVLSSLTISLFFITYILYEMSYHKVIEINNIDLILIAGFISAIFSFIASILASIKLYKLSRVFGFSS